MKAIWNGEILAASDDTVVVEGNHYFPASSLVKSFFESSDRTSHCPWKGDASYYSVVVNGEENVDAAWYYPTPKEAAIQIADRVAFWSGVQIVA
jgi:uncharacterized protein (DUF427 family)